MSKPSREKTAIIQMLKETETELKLVQIDKEYFDTKDAVLTDRIETLKQLLTYNTEK